MAWLPANVSAFRILHRVCKFVSTLRGDHNLSIDTFYGILFAGVLWDFMNVKMGGFGSKGVGKQRSKPSIKISHLQNTEEKRYKYKMKTRVASQKWWHFLPMWRIDLQSFVLFFPLPLIVEWRKAKHRLTVAWNHRWTVGTLVKNDLNFACTLSGFGQSAVEIPLVGQVVEHAVVG